MTLQDIRHGARVLGKSPGLTCAAFLSLGLAIGANTTVFTLINTVLLRPLPVAAPDELVLFSVAGGDESFSYPLYEDFREQSVALSGILAAGGGMRMRLAIAGADGRRQSESVQAQPVSGNFFSVLGIDAIVGRTLLEQDEQGGDARPVVVISERYWTRRFGRDPAIVGRDVLVDDFPVTVVGVAPPGFVGINISVTPDLWWPLRMLPSVRPESKALLQPGNFWLLLVGRLAPRATRVQATAEMDAVFQRYQAERARSRAAPLSPWQQRDLLSQTLQLQPGGTGWTGLRRQFRRPLLILMALVAIVLLVACVNIANLRLVSGIARQQELAMRIALGATRRRVIGQLLTESLLLAVGGGLLGIAASVWAARVLVTYLPAMPGALDVTPDGRVLAFTCAVTVATGVFFGLAPALRATRISATRQPVLRTRTSDALIVMQFALCVSLLVGAGLFMRTLQNLRGVDVGFVPSGLTVFALDAPTTYTADQRLDLYERVRARLAALPEVRSASFSIFGMLGGNGWSEWIESMPDADLLGDTATRGVLVSPRFFETIGTPLVRGRELRPDGSDADRFAVINETMARRYFPGRNPIGETFGIRGWSREPFEIIGVVPDSKYRTLREQPVPTFYVYVAARPQLPFDVTFEVRPLSPATALPPIERLVSQIDPAAQVVQRTTMDAVVDFVLVQERLVANLASALAFLALLLAAVGLYGVTAYTVARRTSEIGVRMAVGARPGDILGLVLRRSSATTGLGIALGLAGAAGTARYVEALLFGVTPIDPMTFAAVVLVFGATVMLAAFIPARRATKVDPLLALRCE